MNREVTNKVETDFFGEGGLGGRQKKVVKEKEVRIPPSEAQVAERRVTEHARRQREAEARIQAWFDAGMIPKDRQQVLKLDVEEQEAEFEEMEPKDGETAEHFNQRSAEALEKVESVKMELAALERRMNEPAIAVKRAHEFVEKELIVEGISPSVLSRTIQKDIARTKLTLHDAEFRSAQQQAARQHMEGLNAQLAYLRALQSDPASMQRIETQRAELKTAIEKAAKEREADDFGKATTVGQTMTPEMFDTGVKNLPRLEDEAEIVNAPERPPIYDREANKDTASGESVVSELPVEAIAPLEDERLGEEPGEAVDVGMEAAEAADRLKAEPVTAEQPRPVIAKKMKPVPIPYPEPVVSGGLNPTYAAPKSVERIQPEKYNLGNFVAETARDAWSKVSSWFGGKKSESSPAVADASLYQDNYNAKNTITKDNRRARETREEAWGKRENVFVQTRYEAIVDEKAQVDALLTKDKTAIDVNKRIASRKKAGASALEISGLEKRYQARREAIKTELRSDRVKKADEAAAAK